MPKNLQTLESNKEPRYVLKYIRLEVLSRNGTVLATQVREAKVLENPHVLSNVRSCVWDEAKNRRKWGKVKYAPFEIRTTPFEQTIY